MLPNLPTDNLYKFEFIAGLTLTITSIILFVTQYDKLYDKIADHKIAITELKTNVDFLKTDLTIIKKDIVTLKHELKISDSIKTNDSHRDLENLGNAVDRNKNINEKNTRQQYQQDELTHQQEKIETLRRMYQRNDTLFRKNTSLSNILNTKIELAQKEYQHLIIFYIISILTLILGCVMAKNGYDKWLILVQKPTDEKLLLELKQLKESLTGTKD